MSAWENVLESVFDQLKQLCEKGISDPFFRGQSDVSWKLICGAGRKNIGHSIETRLYYNFCSLGGHIFEPGISSWDILYLMQHHGLPTRLLDWTENFAVALYYALLDAKDECAIWILDPYALNQEMQNIEHVEYLDVGYPEGYESYFIDDRLRLINDFRPQVVAVASKKSNIRMRSQRGVFTLHKDINKPLEEMCLDAIKKIVIPMDAFPEAKQFLRLAGINEFSLYPDLDGLCRYLIKEEL